ncbi:MAG: hypothetical protein IPK22_10730 [Verrucomicrobiaceae bacterium]|nr:hypothetical protein [Verrucomicrobiaceae bacterium]
MSTRRVSVRRDDDVFINCPFDESYVPVFRAVVFAVCACQFVPRCALEADDGVEVRVEKIIRIMKECPLSIHDISRTELDDLNHLPRFNMPFELGLYLGIARSGRSIRRSLILDSEPYRYQKFLSDIAGQDIRSHSKNPEKAISHVRNWLASAMPGRRFAGGRDICSLYRKFMSDLPDLLSASRIEHVEITFIDWYHLISTWLQTVNQVSRPSGIKH